MPPTIPKEPIKKRGGGGRRPLWGPAPNIGEKALNLTLLPSLLPFLALLWRFLLFMWHFLLHKRRMQPKCDGRIGMGFAKMCETPLLKMLFDCQEILVI